MYMYITKFYKTEVDGRCQRKRAVVKQNNCKKCHNKTSLGNKRKICVVCQDEDAIEGIPPAKLHCSEFRLVTFVLSLIKIIKMHLFF